MQNNEHFSNRIRILGLQNNLYDFKKVDMVEFL